MKRSTRILSILLIVAALVGVLAVCSSAASDDVKTGIGIVKASALRLRAEPNTSSTIKATAYRNDYVVIVSKTGEWYEVVYNLRTGYMHGSYLTVKERENVELGNVKVNCYLANVRSKPNTNSSIVAQASSGASLYTIGFNCGWYKVIYDGKTGYIRSDLAELSEIPYDNTGSSTSPKYFHEGDPIRGSSSSGSGSSGSSSGSSNSGSSSTSAGQAIANKAKQYIGVPYVWGGSSPSGFDCSGFTQYVMRACGYSINRTATAQLSNGYTVGRSELKPGDLVFFERTYNVDAPVSHVGIYVGNDHFIHSCNSGVAIASLNSEYYASRYVTARRIAG